MLSSITWDGGAGTDLWADALNWSGDALPTATDDVLIDAPLLSAGVHISSGTHSLLNLTSNAPLVVDGGTLNVGGTATIPGGLKISSGQISTFTFAATIDLQQLNWSGGTINGPGKFRLGSGGTGAIVGSNPKSLVSRFENAGNVTYSGSGLKFGSTSVSRTIALANSGTFRFENAGTIASASTSIIHLIDNTGTIENGAASLASMSVYLKNTGVVAMGTGDMDLRGGGSSTTPLSVPAGTTLTLAGFSLNAPLIAAGDVKFVGGMTTLPNNSVLNGAVTVSQTLAINQDLIISRLTVATGSAISGSGNLSVSESLDWTGGQFSGTGTLTLQPGTTTRFSDGARTLSRPLANFGTLNWTAGNLTINPTGTFLNEGSIDLTLASGTTQLSAATPLQVFNNKGSLTQHGPGVWSLAAAWNNTGTIEIASAAELQTTTRPGTNAGSIHISPGAKLQLGSSTTFAQGSTIYGEGKATLISGTMTLDPLTYLVSGVTEFNGATVVVQRELTLISPTLKGVVTFEAVPILVNPVSSGTIRTIVPPTVTGVVTVQSGTLTFDTGAAALALDALTVSGGTAKFGGSVPATVDTLILKSTLDITGAGVNVSGALESFTATVSGTAPLTVLDNATWRFVTIGSTAPTLTVTGQVINHGTLAITSPAVITVNGGTLTNEGTLTLSTAQSETLSFTKPKQALAGEVINNGLIDVISGTLVATTLTNGADGVVSLAQGSTLRFSGNATLSTGSRIEGEGNVDFSAGQVTTDEHQVASTVRLLFTGDAATVQLGHPVVTSEATLRGTLTFNNTFTSTSTTALRTYGSVTFNNLAAFENGVAFLTPGSASAARSVITFNERQTVFVPSLTLGATLVGAVELVPTVSASLTSGGIGINATLRIPNGAVATISETKLAGTLINEGTLTPYGSGTGSRYGYLVLTGGTLINRNLWLLDQSKDRFLSVLNPSQGSGSQIINNGTIRVETDNASLTLAGEVTNNHSIYVSGPSSLATVVGTLYQNADIEAGNALGQGTFAIDGAAEFADGSRLFGSGGFGFRTGNFVLTPDFFQSNRLSVGNGTFNPTPAAIVRVTFPITLDSGVSVYTNGNLTFDAGVVFQGITYLSGTINSPNAPVTFAGDTVLGEGNATINGDLVLSGNVSLGVKRWLVVNGDLHMAKDSLTTLKIVTSRPSQYSTRLIVNGTATLSPSGTGRSRLEIESTHTLLPGENEDVIYATELAGGFDHFYGRTSSGDPLEYWIVGSGEERVRIYRYILPAVVPVCTSVTYEDLVRQAVTLTFNQDLRLTLAAHDFELLSTTSPDPVLLAPSQLSFTSDGKTATLLLTNQLANGHYQLRLRGSEIEVGAGTTMANDVFLNFDVLAGDIDGNGYVNFDDLLTLARNYGQWGRTFAQGNVDRSAYGAVNFDDLLMLARNYGQSLPSALMSAPLLGTEIVNHGTAMNAADKRSATRKRATSDLLG